MLIIFNNGVRNESMDYLFSGTNYIRLSDDDETGDPVYQIMGEPLPTTRDYVIFDHIDELVSQCSSGALTIGPGDRIIFLFKHADLADGIGDSFGKKIQMLDELLNTCPVLKGSIAFVCTDSPDSLRDNQERLGAQVQYYIDKLGTQNLGFITSFISPLYIDDGGDSRNRIFEMLNVHILKSDHDRSIDSVTRFADQHKLSISFLLMTAAYLSTIDWKDSQTYFRLTATGFIALMTVAAYQKAQKSVSVAIREAASHGSEAIRYFTSGLKGNDILKSTTASLVRFMNASLNMQSGINGVLGETQKFVKNAGENLSLVTNALDMRSAQLTQAAIRSSETIMREVSITNSNTNREASMTGAATRDLMGAGIQFATNTDRRFKDLVSAADGVVHATNKVADGASNAADTLATGFVDALNHDHLKPEANLKICTML